MRIDRPGAGDRPGEGRDRPRETGNLRSPGHGLDTARMMTPDEVAREAKKYRGELRYDHDKREYVESEPYDWAKKQDRLDRMRAVELPERVRDLPRARDVMPEDLRWNWAEIDKGKLFDYSMNAEHKDNRGKAEGWEKLGYDVRDREARRAAAWEVADLAGCLLPGGHVKGTHETPHGTRYTVVNGFIGPNGRSANLVTGWFIEGERDRKYPRLVTVWVQPHRDKEA